MYSSSRWGVVRELVVWICVVGDRPQSMKVTVRRSEVLRCKQACVLPPQLNKHSVQCENDYTTCVLGSTYSNTTIIASSNTQIAHTYTSSYDNGRVLFD